MVLLYYLKVINFIENYCYLVWFMIGDLWVVRLCFYLVVKYNVIFFNFVVRMIIICSFLRIG